jgi:hypothetical protein
MIFSRLLSFLPFSVLRVQHWFCYQKLNIWRQHWYLSQNPDPDIVFFQWRSTRAREFDNDEWVQRRSFKTPICGAYEFINSSQRVFAKSNNPSTSDFGRLKFSIENAYTVTSRTPASSSNRRICKWKTYQKKHHWVYTEWSLLEDLLSEELRNHATRLMLSQHLKLPWHVLEPFANGGAHSAH